VSEWSGESTIQVTTECWAPYCEAVEVHAVPLFGSRGLGAALAPGGRPEDVIPDGWAVTRDGAAICPRCRARAARQSPKDEP
jgi:hypothetical protein